VIQLVSGAGFSQALALASLPIIARLYSVDEVGEYNIFLSVSMLVGILLTFGFNRVVIIADDEDVPMALNLHFLACVFILAVALLVLFAIGQGLSLYCGVVILSIVLSRIHVLESVLYRTRVFSVQALIHSIASILNHPLKIVSGLYLYFSGALLFITMISFFMKLIFISSFLRGSKGLLRVDILELVNSIKYLGGVCSKYRDVFIYRYPQSILAAISAYVPVLGFGYIYGNDVAAYVGIAIGLLGAPVLLVGNSLFNVYQARFSTYGYLDAEKEFYHLMKLNALLFFISIAGVIVLTMISDILVPIVFGQEWSAVASYLNVMAVWFALMFVSKLSLAAISYVGAERFILLSEIVFLFLRVVGILLAWYLGWSDLDNMKLFCFLSSFFYFVVIVYVALKFKGKVNERIAS
jgi:O-antigen/teichoic acid export membrane protein